MKLVVSSAIVVMSLLLTVTHAQTLCPPAADSEVDANYGSAVTGSCSPTPEGPSEQPPDSTRIKKPREPFVRIGWDTGDDARRRGA